jgi:hypothetical protein
VKATIAVINAGTVVGFGCAYSAKCALAESQAAAQHEH